MPQMDARYQKERRDRIKMERMERKRMYREKVAEGRKKTKETAEVAERSKVCIIDVNSHITVTHL